MLSLSHLMKGQDSCQNPEDFSANLLTEIYYEGSVNTELGDQYYRYTASSNGTFQIGSCNAIDSRLSVYLSDCNLLIELDNNACITGEVFNTSVATGDTYIFRWSTQNAEEFTFTAKFEFPGQAGESCASPSTMTLGENTVSQLLSDSYFTYTATSPGQMIIETCIDQSEVSGTNLNLYNSCDLISPVAINEACADQGGNGHVRSSLSYYFETDETLILKTSDILEWSDTYRFNLILEDGGTSGRVCYDPIEISDNMSNELLYQYTVEDNGATGRIFSFTAPSDCSFNVHGSPVGLSNYPHLKVYKIPATF